MILGTSLKSLPFGISERFPNYLFFLQRKDIIEKDQTLKTLKTKSDEGKGRELKR